MFFAVLLVAGAGVLAFQGAAYYYYQRSSECQGPCLEPTVPIATLINYGNGTREWINKTAVPSSWDFYQLTESIVSVQAKFYGPPTSEHFVTGINGVVSNQQHFWSLWAICQKSSAWYATGVGADAIHVTAYHTFAWYYQASSSQDSSAWNPPIPGASKVSTC